MNHVQPSSILFPSVTGRVIAIALATFSICLLAQVAIPLPFTPVPLTGQTFGVILTALLLGKKDAAISVTAYLTAGAVGLPVFALGARGLALGPSVGYLFGMLAAAWVVGSLADRGYASSFGRAWISAFVGSLFIFGFGLIGLSFFVPKSQIWMAGLLPFIPGDLIKTTLAASIASVCRKTRGTIGLKIK
jgi:biotin transport system substrate-specific component